ncbi:MAG TPA: homoserine kinase [Stellaceae bacterium]|nr:homoserine kinase [Stellaceae bacterium]
MAVYTEVSDVDLRRFIAEYDIGAVLSCKGIAEGVENSNFLIGTERGTFILTIYEKRVAPRDLPFFLGLMDHLAARGLACPRPMAGRDGVVLRSLCGKPAAIIEFLDGLWPRQLTDAHCPGVGKALATLHVAGSDFTMTRPNALSVAGWHRELDACRERAHEVEPGLAEELAGELATIERAWPTDLPTGVIHADLFPDNVFFKGTEVTGLIDFYFACTDAYAYDVAICLNAWCFDDQHHFVPSRARALLSAYQEVRPFTAAERAAMPLLARGGALRFLLTRLHDWLNRPPGALVQPKDPREYLMKLRFHRTIPGPEGYGL